MRAQKAKPLFRALLVLIIVSAACTGIAGNYGHLKKSDQVKKTFEDNVVLDGYQYYYFGPDNFPQAIIGIHKAYKMEATLWKPVDVSPEMFHDWIWGHANRPVGYPGDYGSEIIGSGGEHIGVYYSLKESDQWVSIEIKPGKTVSISSPRKPRNSGVPGFFKF